MKKLFIPVLVLVMVACALSVVSETYNTNPEKTAVGEPAAAQSIASPSADVYSADRSKTPVGLNAENQYDILAKNKLYGHNDYGDYVTAKVRYVDGFPTVDGDKKFSKYYENKKYIVPDEEEKDPEDWNLHDFHANGEFFETVGNGTMSFMNEADRDAYIKALEDEYGKENVKEGQYDASGLSADQIQDIVDRYNQSQSDLGDVEE